MMQAQTLIDAIEALAPVNLAWERDVVGLQLGRADQSIDRVMTTLDVRPEVVQEAIDKDVDFIFSHHPLMFHPARTLDLSRPQNQMYADLLRHNIVVYSAHTNLDAAVGGMNDWLAEALQIQNPRPLIPNADGKSGLGRIGQLEQPKTVRTYAQALKDLFNVAAVRVIGPDLERSIQTVAVIGGDGGDHYRQAQQAGADVLVTADLYYHIGHDVIADDFTVIDPDHHMEAIVKAKMVEQIQIWQQAYGWELNAIFPSAMNTDPYQYIV